MPQNDFLLVLAGLITTFVLGTYQGYRLGRSRKVSVKEASAVMAKASRVVRARRKRICGSGA